MVTRTLVQVVTTLTHLLQTLPLIGVIGVHLTTLLTFLQTHP
jgi:hypothetical protein